MDAKQNEERMKARAVFEMKHTRNLHIILSESKGKHSRKVLNSGKQVSLHLFEKEKGQRRRQ